MKTSMKTLHLFVNSINHHSATRKFNFQLHSISITKRKFLLKKNYVTLIVMKKIVALAVAPELIN